MTTSTHGRHAIDHSPKQPADAGVGQGRLRGDHAHRLLHAFARAISGVAPGRGVFGCGVGGHRSDCSALVSGARHEERAQPQRLLVTVEMEFDFSRAAKTDSIADTIDYFAVSQRLLKFGEGKSWKLIEKLATDICDTILSEFRAQSVSVEVKKFVIPQARYVSVIVTRGM